MYTHALVPIDLAHAENAGDMIKAASAMLDDSGKITLLYMMPDIPAMVETYLPDGTTAEARTQAKEELDAIADRGNGPSIDTEVRVGNPAYGILEAAEADKCDLIVIASHQPELADYLLGSTAAKVVRHATCSVHVMR